jgi:hypothetical protein
VTLVPRSRRVPERFSGEELRRLFEVRLDARGPEADAEAA